MRDKRGRVTVLDIPGAKGTEAVKLNDRGQAVGEYSQDTLIVNDSANPRDYLWDRGSHHHRDPRRGPGADRTARPQQPRQVVGPYLDRNGALGFLWDEGRITPSTSGATGTSPTAVNDRGQLLGVYTDGRSVPWLCGAGRYVSFDAPDQGLPASSGHQQPRRSGLHGRRPGHHGRRARVPAAKGQGARHADQLPGCAWDHRDRHQRPGADRRLLREPQRRAEPATHRRATPARDRPSAGPPADRGLRRSSLGVLGHGLGLLVEPGPTGEEATMASTPRTSLRRLRLAVTAVVGVAAWQQPSLATPEAAPCRCDVNRVPEQDEGRNA